MRKFIQYVETKMTKDLFAQSLKELIEKFERSEEYYKSKAYMEDELRQEFINPFFTALGWVNQLRQF